MQEVWRHVPNSMQLHIRFSLSKSAQIYVLGEDQITKHPAKILAPATAFNGEGSSGRLYRVKNPSDEK